MKTRVPAAAASWCISVSAMVRAFQVFFFFQNHSDWWTSGHLFLLLFVDLSSRVTSYPPISFPFNLPILPFVWVLILFSFHHVPLFLSSPPFTFGFPFHFPVLPPLLPQCFRPLSLTEQGGNRHSRPVPHWNIFLSRTTCLLQAVKERTVTMALRNTIWFTLNLIFNDRFNMFSWIFIKLWTTLQNCHALILSFNYNRHGGYAELHESYRGDSHETWDTGQERTHSNLPRTRSIGRIQESFF